MRHRAKRSSLHLGSQHQYGQMRECHLPGACSQETFVSYSCLYQGQPFAPTLHDSLHELDTMLLCPRERAERAKPQAHCLLAVGRSSNRCGRGAGGFFWTPNLMQALAGQMPANFPVKNPIPIVGIFGMCSTNTLVSANQGILCFVNGHVKVRARQQDEQHTRHQTLRR